MTMTSVQVAQELSLSPMHVRNMLSKMCRVAERLGYETFPPHKTRYKIRERRNLFLAKLPCDAELLSLARTNSPEAIAKFFGTCTPSVTDRVTVAKLRYRGRVQKIREPRTCHPNTRCRLQYLWILKATVGHDWPTIAKKLGIQHSASAMTLYRFYFHGTTRLNKRGSLTATTSLLK